MVNQNRMNNSQAMRMLSKVPEITLYFWVIKVLCTTVGETASDFLNVNLNLGLTGTSIIMGILLAVVLFFQFRSKKYTPSLYWVTVVLISIFGTLVTDNLTDSMGVPLEVSTIIFSVLLAMTFVVWHAKEKTLAIHSILTTRREAFYWLAILFTFALGTATGDLMAESLGLGYLVTGFIVCGVIALASIAWRLGLNSILAFWIIYIMTRPLGASLGDYLSQSPKYGGLGLGPTVTSVIFLLAILGTVIFLSITKKDLINKKSIAEEEVELKQSGGLWQTAVVMSLLLVVSGIGYYWRHTALQAVAENPTPVVQQSDSSLVSSTTTPNSKAISRVVKTLSPLGDVSGLRAIAQDALNMINSGNLSGAKTRVDDWEYEWDNSQSRLKPKNPAKWTEVDDASDKMLRQLRAVNQNAAGCKSSLEALLATLN